MTELGVGYLSIVADTSKLPGQVQKALDGGQAQADKAGQGMGSKLATGLGKTLKVGVVGAGAAAAGVLATSITKGLGRLNAIEQAEAKLSGLGNSTQNVGKIMDNALTSVRGTAFGLGDAATVAASAVAAGVKPGRELERTLKLTGDAATIAGVGMNEMGAIFNKVAASNKIQGDVIAQLNDAGIPIVQLLGQELGKTAEETLKLASEGSINFETFQRAMETGLGGSALEAGNTASGAFDNLNAALGRFGATLAGPIFDRAPAAFGKLTDAVDDLDARMKPVMEQFGADLTSRYIPALQEFGRAGVEAFEQFRSSEIAQSSLNRLTGIFEQLQGSARDVAPAVGTIASSLARASASLGVSTWQIFLTTLEASATILDGTVVPALQLVAGLMESQQGLVTAGVAAWLGFKTIPGVLDRVKSTLIPVVGTAKTAALGFRDIVTATGGIASAGDRGTISLGRFGSTVSAIGMHVPIVHRMQDSFVTAATGADRFGHALGAVAAAGTGIRAGLSGIVSMLGGPWMIALAGVTAATVGVVTEWGKAGKQAETLTGLSRDLARGQGELADAFALSGGAVDDGVLDAAAAKLETLSSAQQEIIDNGAGWKPIAMFTAGIKDMAGWFTGQAQAGTDAWRVQVANTEAAERLQDQFTSLGLTTEDLNLKVVGSTSSWNAFQGQLRAAGSVELADALQGQRDEFLRLQESMERVGPASLAVTSGIQEIAESAGDGDKRLSGLRRALEGLGILETDAQAALFETAETVRNITEAAAQGVDPVNGLGEALIGLDGNLDHGVVNAASLRESLMQLGEAFFVSRNAGNDSATAYGQIRPALEQLAETYQLPIEKLEELTRQWGLAPRELDLSISVAGGDEAWRAVTDLQLRLEQLPDDGTPKTVSMYVEDEQARQAIANLGFDVQQIGDNPATVEVTANNTLALIAMDQVRGAVAGLDISIANPKIGADTTFFRLEDQNVRNMLAGIDMTSVAPEVGAVIDGFLSGRDITLAELSQIDLSTAEPDVRLLIEQALSQSRVVNEAIDHTARERTATITVRDQWDPAARAAHFGSADIQGPFATGGRLSKTGPGSDRTDGILGVASSGMPIARVDAGEWIINGRSSDRYDRELAAINAGTFPKLPGYESGGVVGAGDLLDFVSGRTGGSYPLTGARYVWGGVNWGDCSGAMSAIARFAVGLAPFAGRFATGNQAGALAAMGFSRGRGGPGDLRFGWYNGGPYGGHTAGTLPDGTNVEMGGQYGGGMVGGSTGSDSSEFTDHAFLRIGDLFDWSDPGGHPSGGRGRLTKDGQPMTGTAYDTGATRVGGSGGLSGSPSGASGSSSSGPRSWSEIAGDVAATAASGYLSDALKVFGIPDELPPAMTAWQMLEEAKAEQNAALIEPSADERAEGAQVRPADPPDPPAPVILADTPVVYDPSKGAAQWEPVITEGLSRVGLSLANLGRTIEQTDIESSGNPGAVGPDSTDGNPRGLLQVKPRTFSAFRDPELVDDVFNPLANIVAALRYTVDRYKGPESIWPTKAGYYTGGPVGGPRGVDQVPAWLTAGEFVVNAASAAAGGNPAVLAAINSGAEFAAAGVATATAARGDVGSAFDMGAHERCVHYHFHVADVDEAVGRMRTEEIVRAKTHEGAGF
ncbi:hypothetical protein DW322_08860 [Rhodococcus rhodnii]|uniref:Uncharacterized protein n=2 Tax=Rhodococcus rhodnii TaxID=38312 RepID=R7WRJ3_9NOCA|nr:tape measure protein [Rhodococcus rhodnii]EOM77900.1 hypothetical protein Rrhod_0709 [Rhodococcus rhodnii LMG 5362]TXG90315.1 hypothetical protein DW322_08860 [Rhodococcus rhodnii]